MTRAGKPVNAIEELRKRHVKNDPVRLDELQRERINVEVAQLICDARTDAGLTQSELAELVGTTQSVISRLEQADYDGHSLSMLDRIARALNRRVQVTFNVSPQSNEPATAREEGSDLMMRYAFVDIVRSLRRYHAFSLEHVAKKLGIDQNEALAIERDPNFRLTPLLIYKLSSLYGIPQQRLAILAGAVRSAHPELREQASRFAAKSESFARLTEHERETLDEFVRFLKAAPRKAKEYPK